MHLLQRWQELRNRELTAQQHNKQLLQQFEDAQDTLRDMLSLTANMKTMRVHTLIHTYMQTVENGMGEFRKHLKKGHLTVNADYDKDYVLCLPFPPLRK